MNDEAAGVEDSRGTVDYILRTAQQNTLQLSAMADQKASVVLGASFVMASIVFGDLTATDDRAIATIILAVTAVTAGLLAALSIIPRTGSRGGRRNLLFFASIAELDHDEYLRQMRQMLGERDALYEAVLEDLYQASVVLRARKYPLLRASYVALTTGMVATLVAVLIS